MRAILGNKVRHFVMAYCNKVAFITPDICVADVEKYLPQLSQKHHLPHDLLDEIMKKILELIQIIDYSVYEAHK